MSAAPASAGTVINGCAIVSNPTPTNFTNCPGADLQGANLSGLDLSYANLSGASFVACSTSVQIVFGGITVVSASCVGADLSGAQLVDANLSGSAMVATIDVPQRPFPDALAIGVADLSNANLTGADLTGVALGGCTAFNFICEGVGLNGANVTGTLLVPANQTVEATSTGGTTVTYPLSGGTSCSPQSGSTFPIGTSTVFCNFVDGNGGVATGTFTVTVTPPTGGTATATSLSASVNVSLVNQQVTYTATVSPTPPGGTVTFNDNGTPIAGCSAIILSGTIATCSTTFVTAGSHDIAAVYSGSGTFESSVSSTLDQALTGTSTSIRISEPSANLLLLDQPVTYTATVSPTPSGGTVAFSDNGSPIAGCSSVALLGNSATCTTTPGTAGVHHILATYSGLPGFLGSTSPSAVTVLQTRCKKLAGCNLSGFYLSLSGFEIFELNLANADLQGANLSGANLEEDDLTGANLVGANLMGADLTLTNLRGASLKGANVNNVTWKQTICPDGTNSADNPYGTCVGHL